ncbi:MAG: YdeI/OmpD-associated family protein [Chitinophagaceae bacterium]
MSRSAQVDQYILKSADFAQVILEHIRFLVHTACPEVEEQIKWSFPNFVYKGKILCHMAAFKHHCSFGFWNSDTLEDPEHLLQKSGRTAMGNLGRIESIEQFPDSDAIIFLLKSAMLQIDNGSTVKKAKKVRPLEIPIILTEALANNPEANAHFERFSTSQKREYADWINEAKTDATREKRLQTTIEWLSEGKTRQWKYQKNN